MDLVVRANVTARFGGRLVRCALGRSGVTALKREGDGATPIGVFACRFVYWRPDRLAKPRTRLEAIPLSPRHGWCDDPNDASYNRPVLLPFTGSHEKLWREDAVYDLIVALGYNDVPPILGCGSAIFLHVARPGRLPTAGCVALSRQDLLRFLSLATPMSRVVIRR